MVHPRPHRSILGIVLTGFILLATASIASGQGAPGFHLGLSAGADFPVGDQEDIYNVGWNGTLSLIWNFGVSGFGLRLDGQYHQLTVQDELEPLFIDAKARLIDGTFDFVFGPHIGTWVQPYILGGVGVYDVRFSGEDVLDNVTFAESDTRFGWNAGTGVAFRVSDQSDIHLYIEGRYHSVDLDRDRFFDSNNRFEVITVNSGVVF
jgi:opacity protein-like surface antigen